MPQRIESLTPEQAAHLPVFPEEWRAHGLSTAPADRPTAEAGIRALYESIGRTPPPIIFTLTHPEHAHCLMGPGVYEVGFQKDEAEAERRAVRD